jgi:hypothetical protein
MCSLITDQKVTICAFLAERARSSTKRCHCKVLERDTRSIEQRDAPTRTRVFCLACDDELAHSVLQKHGVPARPRLLAAQGASTARRNSRLR